MAQISPFRGIRYNTDKIISYGDVITPPYDVISKKDQSELYKRNEYNLIKLEYGLDYPGDDENNNRYTRAANFFNDWLKRDILIREDVPVFYWYEQEFKWKDKIFKREGLIGTIKLESYEKKSVLPHEETLSKPKEDRLKLLDHCQANLSPIFGLYPDKENFINRECSGYIKNSPFLSFTDYEGQCHRLWKLTDISLQKKIKSYFSDWWVFLADGHHRYETALNFSKIMKSKNRGGYDHVLVFLFNLYDPDLLILPTHRIIHKIKGFSAEKFLQDLNKYFIVEYYGNASVSLSKKFTEDLEKSGNEKQVMGLCLENGLYHIILKNNPQNLSIDVDVLQKYIFEETLNLTPEDLRSGDKLTYTRSEEEAVFSVVGKNALLSFLLNPSPIEQIVAVAKEGIRLPQKSTYFYPKLISGLLINKLGD